MEKTRVKGIALEIDWNWKNEIRVHKRPFMKSVHMFIYGNWKKTSESNLFFKHTLEIDQTSQSGLAKQPGSAFFLQMIAIAVQSILYLWCKFHFPCRTKLSVESQKTQFYW